MCPPKHVDQLRNIGIINSTTRLHLVGSFYEIYITMHGSMNIRYVIRNLRSPLHIIPWIISYIRRGRPTWPRAAIFRHYDSCVQTFGRTPWTDGWNIARTLSTPDNTNMPWMGFEPTTQRSKRHKIAHILDRTTNVIWTTYYHNANHVWSDWQGKQHAWGNVKQTYQILVRKLWKKRSPVDPHCDSVNT